MPFLRYILIIALVYLLIRLIMASLRNFFVNLTAHRQQQTPDKNNVSGGKKANLKDIPEAKYEEIKDDAGDRKR